MRLPLICAASASASELSAPLCDSVVEQLQQLAWARGCYKIILDCAEKNVGFYQRCGFSAKEIQMALYKAKL